jgi:hypothetical protein
VTSGDADLIKWVEIPNREQLVADGLDKRLTNKESLRMIHCIQASSLFEDMQDGEPRAHPELKICFVLLDRPDEKKGIKKYLDKSGIVS